MRFLAALAALLLCSCATTGYHDPRDPWEGMNRAIWDFNEWGDKVVVKPIAKGYVAVLPQPVRTGINNFFGNLDDVATSLNNFAQGKPVEGFNDFGRVIVNTTFGILGFRDVASQLDIEKHNEDFGQTLGWWGVPPGPYFVIPLLGPSTVRDAPARVVDPGLYYGYKIDNPAVTWTLFGMYEINLRANLLKAESVLEEAAIDRYTFVRDAWLQRRRNQVYDGNPPDEPEPEDTGDTGDTAPK